MKDYAMLAAGENPSFDNRTDVHSHRKMLCILKDQG